MEQQTNGKPSGKGGVGPILGIIIIIILLALGGLYYFTKGASQVQNQNAAATTQTPADEAATIATQGTSANLNAVQADVNATDLSGLDSATANVSASLQTQ
jgi:flagellar basal body-associated protein FliL